MPLKKPRGRLQLANFIWLSRTRPAGHRRFRPQSSGKICRPQSSGRICRQLQLPVRCDGRSKHRSPLAEDEGRHRNRRKFAGLVWSWSFRFRRHMCSPMCSPPPPPGSGSDLYRSRPAACRQPRTVPDWCHPRRLSQTAKSRNCNKKVTFSV